MSIFKTSDSSEMMVTCSCGCHESLCIHVDNNNDEFYCYQIYLSGNWYKEQADFLQKLKKIWRILRNKDYCYSEIYMTKEDWEEFKEWINSQ